jgi:hypothetical protein
MHGCATYSVHAACILHSPAVNWRQRTWSSRHLVGCRGAQFCGRCLPFARSASRVLDEASACFRRGGGRLAALATFFVTRAKQAGCLGRGAHRSLCFPSVVGVGAGLCPRFRLSCAGGLPRPHGATTYCFAGENTNKGQRESLWQPSTPWPRARAPRSPKPEARSRSRAQSAAGSGAPSPAQCPLLCSVLPACCMLCSAAAAVCGCGLLPPAVCRLPFLVVGCWLLGWGW